MKKLMFLAMVVLVVAMSIVPAFAANDTAVTSAMLEPIVDSITANIAVIMPVGITIFGVMIGLSLVPRIIRFFTHA